MVDRSSSMAGSKWRFVVTTLSSFAARYEGRAAVGVRAFPGGNGCQVGAASTITVNDVSQAVASLEAPGSAAQTPIAEALRALAPRFGDPSEGQAVVLLTDGDETCADDPDQAVAEAEVLFRSGVRTYAIGVSNQANPGLLDRIAAAGGTRTRRQANDAASLEQALDDILAELRTCAAPPPPPDGGVGATCTVDAECTSGSCMSTGPFGIVFPGGYCTQSCQPGGCPSGSTCLVDPIGGNNVCIQLCELERECREGYRCLDLPSFSERGCLPEG